ncbi:hypothetical protein ACNR9V_03090 [Parageobacillus thermoglucosidasius]|uniref:hypothetical protein n=1 Tax=Parageobacillus thermoglucosidasius TaxID=1426 RepID=UPI003B685E3E
MTKAEQKRIRLQIIELLDQCEGCPHRYKFGSSVRICPSCPIGQEMQALWKKLGERERQNAVRRPWTTQEEEFLLQNLHMKKRELAEKLGRSLRSIQNKIFELRKKGRIHDAS